MNDKIYKDLILSTDIADYSNIKGTIILKPYGYKIWDNIKKVLNKILIKNKYKNFYFPSLIPKNLFDIENKYLKVFPKECAIVAYTKFKINKLNKIVIDKKSKLNTPLIIRPTSETIIWSTIKKWIESYRNLPLLINQWCNIVRLEMRNKMFIRNSEFLWQEGHSVHLTKKDALKEIKKIKKIYNILFKKYLSIPFVSGYKTKKERFPGAEFTYTFETITKNKGKAIQLATIHFLSKNFSNAFNVKYTDKNGTKKNPYGISFGLSTRIIGAIIMIHNDKNGIILPPKIAPIQVVIIPLTSSSIIKKRVYKIKSMLKKLNISLEIDNDFNSTPGHKFYKYDKMGIPLKIIIGNNEIKNNTILLIRRDTRQKYYLEFKRCICNKISEILNKLQVNLYRYANICMKKKTYLVKSFKSFKNQINTKCGFYIAYFSNNIKNENKIQTLTKATIRCIINKSNNKKKCFYSQKYTNNKVILGKSY